MLNSIGSVVFQGRIHYAGTYHGCVTYVTAHNFIHYTEKTAQVHYTQNFCCCAV